MSMNMSLKQASEMEIARMARDGVDADALMDGTTLELEKSWHALHYLFTGQQSHGPMPASALLSGGRAIGEDLGYGPARALSAQETKAFAQFLAGETATALTGRIDLATMERLGIYAAADDPAEDVDHYFPPLQAYVGEAAKNGRGLLIWMM